MKKALLLTNHFHDLGGSEIVALEVGETLLSMGYQVSLKCNLVDERFLRFVDSRIDVSDADIDYCVSDYDFIWAQHNLLAFGRCETLEDWSRPVVASVHLSAKTGLEGAGIASAMAVGAPVVVNSQAGVDILHNCGVPGEYMINFRNACPDAFARLPQRADPLQTPGSLLVVSNHLPPEVREAARILRSNGVSVISYGRRQDHYERLTPDVVQRADAVVSIGKTCQYAICAGIPVYCYDHFGGPGWLSGQNIDLAEYRNFSGKCTKHRKTGRQIATEILDGYVPAARFAQDIRPQYAPKYSLERFISELIARNLHMPPSPQAIAILHSQRSNATVLRQIYRRSFEKRHKPSSRFKALFGRYDPFALVKPRR